MAHFLNSNSDIIFLIPYKNEPLLSNYPRPGLGGSPGLVVMGGDSSPKSHGFESRYLILDGHYFTYHCCEDCNVC